MLGSDDELMEFLWGQSAKNMLSQCGIVFGGERRKIYRELTNLPFLWLPPIKWCQYQLQPEVADRVGDGEVDAMDLDM